MLIRNWAVLEEHDGKASGSAGAGDGSAGSDQGGDSSKGKSESGSGASGDEGGDDGDDDEEISPEAFRRMKADLKKTKSKLREVSQKEKDRESASLKEKGQWKEAAERAERERDEEKSAREESESRFRNSLRSSRVVELALKAGLRPEARDDLDLLDLDEVEVESTDSGRYIVRGADRFVENLKKRKPYLFKTGDGKGAPTFNGGGGKGGSSGGGAGTGGEGDSGEAPTWQQVWAAEKKYGKKDQRFIDLYNKAVKARSKK